MAIINVEDIRSLGVFQMPCHTQNVERHIKLVTESAQKVANTEPRDGYIRNTIESRKIMPKFETKNDFKF